MTEFNRFKSERKRMGYTQEQVARKLNTSRSNVANWENGQNMPSLDLLFKCSDLYDCDVLYLAGHQNERKSNNSDDFPLELYEYDIPFESMSNPQKFEELLKYEKIISKDFIITDEVYDKIMNFIKNNIDLFFNKKE